MDYSLVVNGFGNAFLLLHHGPKIRESPAAERDTFCPHGGGHEEGEGNPGWGWTDRQWEEEARKLWKADGLEGTVRVPAMGEEIDI